MIPAIDSWNLVELEIFGARDRPGLAKSGSKGAGQPPRRIASIRPGSKL